MYLLIKVNLAIKNFSFYDYSLYQIAEKVNLEQFVETHVDNLRKNDNINNNLITVKSYEYKILSYKEYDILSHFIT